MQSHIFYPAFLITLIFCEENMLINFGFLIKKDFWYVIFDKILNKSKTFR